MTYEPTATDIFANVPLVPGEGVRAELGVYAEMVNVDSAQIFYG